MLLFQWYRLLNILSNKIRENSLTRVYFPRCRPNQQWPCTHRGVDSRTECCPWTRRGAERLIRNDLWRSRGRRVSGARAQYPHGSSSMRSGAVSACSRSNCWHCSCYWASSALYACCPPSWRSSTESIQPFFNSIS